jgi:prolipoprotein diacylglyceryltransferase
MIEPLSMYPPVSPIIFEIGPFALRWYGLLMLAAILTAATLAGRYVARRGENPRQPLGHAVLDIDSRVHWGATVLRVYSVPQRARGAGLLPG